MKPIFVAVDTPELEQARDLAAAVAPLGVGLKLGLEFYCRNGRAGVEALAQAGAPIFLDLKFHDIPNTVAGALRGLSPLAPAVLTVHAAGGRAMMEAARAAADPKTKVIAVTVLTSLDPQDLKAIGVDAPAEEQVSRLASLAWSAGLDGIVCSGNELATAREAWPDGYFVVPGIRPAGASVGDQKRVMTPGGALDAGASALVIGRPITAAADPAEALRAILGAL